MPAPKDPEKYEEWRKKLKAAKVGWIPWNKGRKISLEPQFDEYRKKIGDASRGKTHPGKPMKEEVKKKLSERLKGKKWGFANGWKHSEETKKKMSASHKGVPTRPMSEEQKKKLSEIVKRNYQEKPELLEKLKGRIVSEESKNKQRKSLEKFYNTEAGIRFKEKLSKLGKLNAKEFLPDYHKEAISKGVTKAIKEGRLGETYNRVTGHHLSPKAGKVHHRSSYELTAYQILDGDENVLTYKVESFSIPYKFDGIKHNYTPDLLVTYKDNSTKVIEVKPKYMLSDPQTQAKHSAASLLLGSKFEIWTEDELCQI